MPGPILQCLSVSSIAFEPATGPHGVHGYRLTLNMQQAWERCERILHDVQRRLILRAGVSYLDMTVPPTPFSFRYTRGWATIPELRRQLTMSLAAFVGRLALISYFLLKEESRGISTWDKLSAGADPVPLAVTNALRLTWLGDWSVHRVGAFVDIGRSISPSSGAQWHRDMPLFLSTGSCIPLWFAFKEKTACLDSVLPSLTTRLRAIYRPESCWFESLPAVAQGVFSRETEDKSRVQTPWHYCYSVVTLASHVFPCFLHLRRRGSFATVYSVKLTGGRGFCFATTSSGPSHSSVFNQHLTFSHRQRAGEDYPAFMERNHAEKQLMFARETEHERRSRKQREASHQTQNVPLAFPPAVFLWTYHPSLGLALRTRVSLSDVQPLWESTSPAVRVYNSYRDEYDIFPCPPSSNSSDSSNQLIPDAVLEDVLAPTTGAVAPSSSPELSTSTNLSSADDFSFPSVDTILSPTTDSQLGPPPTHTLLNDVTSFSVCLDLPTIHTLNTIDGLRFRFGFIASLTEGIPVPFNAPRAKVLRRLGSWAITDCVRESLLTLIEQFVASIENNRLPREDVFDLPSLMIQATHLAVFTAIPQWPSSYYYAPSGQLFPAPGEFVHVVLKSAHAVHFACRAEFVHTPQTLVEGLVRFGIPFDVY